MACKTSVEDSLVRVIATTCETHSICTLKAYIEWLEYIIEHRLDYDGYSALRLRKFFEEEYK